MAERSARPAVLAGGWRSGPGVVRVAAVPLGLFGVLLVLVEADQGDLDAAELGTALVLVSAAAALVWAGRLGYWLGLTVAALVIVLLVVVLARRPGVAGVVVTAICALPLVLLVAPAARRPRLTTRPAPSSAVRERPQGWTRPFAGGWGQFAFMVVVGGLLSVGGLVLAVTGRGAERGAGAATALFFFACLLTAPLFAPGRRGGPLRRHCCIERLPGPMTLHSGTQTQPIRARSSGSSASLVPSTRESLHFAGSTHAFQLNATVPPAPDAGASPGGHADHAGAGRQDAGRQPAPLPDHRGGADGGDPPPGWPQPPRH